MQIELTPKTEKLLQQILPDQGDASALIEAAVATLADYRGTEAVPNCLHPITGNPLSLDQLRVEIDKGEQDAASGNVAPLDVDDLRRRVHEQHADDGNQE